MDLTTETDSEEKSLLDSPNEVKSLNRYLTNALSFFEYVTIL